MLSRKNFLLKTSLASLAMAMPAALLAELTQHYHTAGNDADVTYFTKTEPQFETLRKGFNKRIDAYPAVIAVVNNTNGVVKALAYAKQKKLKVSVKSGGHCMEGFSCLPGTLVINLSMLNQINLQGTKLTLGPSATLRKIYESILPKGRYIPGGSCQTVAIGGLTLGGGYGLMSRAYGLTCDSLVEATMVNGNGEIVNTKNNTDLLWALRGGNNGNFGIVTELVFNTHAAPRQMMSYRFRNQNITKAKAIEVCKLWFNEVKSLPNTCFSAFIYNGKTTYILLTNTVAPKTAVTSFVNKFKGLSTKFSVVPMQPLAKALQAYYAEANPITFKNASAGLYNSYEDIESVIDEVFTLIQQRPGLMYQVNTLGGKVMDADFAKNSSFPHRNFLYFSELQAYWDSPKANQRFLTQFEAVQNCFARAGVKAQYRNYPDINFNNWASLYYGQNLNRLLEFKAKHDPNNIFGGKQTLTNPS
jgi:hypothetical protein